MGENAKPEPHTHVYRPSFPLLERRQNSCTLLAVKQTSKTHTSTPAVLQVGMRPTAAQQHDPGAACTLTPSSCVSRQGCPFGRLLGGIAAAAVVGAAVGAAVLLAAACWMRCLVAPACSRGAIAAAQCAVSTTAGDRTHTVARGRQHSGLNCLAVARPIDASTLMLCQLVWISLT